MEYKIIWIEENGHYIGMIGKCMVASIWFQKANKRQPKDGWQGVSELKIRMQSGRTFHLDTPQEAMTLMESYMLRWFRALHE